MTHLEIIKEAYDKCGIKYVIRDDENNTPLVRWQYLFLCGERKGEREELETEHIDILTRKRKYIEFKNGYVGSY